jgi:putative ubiquitin-RnfH superfamily antitoxin RatB of RatAB toxin-antitoxin module
MGPADLAGPAGSADGAALHVEVVYCPRPGSCDRVSLSLPAGADLASALQASGMLERHGLSLASLQAAAALGIWCRHREPQALLRDGDRVEVYRPLAVDPKEARRLRYRRQGRGG